MPTVYMEPDSDTVPVTAGRRTIWRQTLIIMNDRLGSLSAARIRLYFLCNVTISDNNLNTNRVVSKLETRVAI